MVGTSNIWVDYFKINICSSALTYMWEGENYHALMFLQINHFGSFTLKQFCCCTQWTEVGVGTGGRHHLPSTSTISSCFEENQPFSRFSLFKKGKIKVRFAILISCFDPCSVCVPGSPIHLLALCVKSQTDKFSLFSWGEPCNVCFLCQSHPLLCAWCLQLRAHAGERSLELSRSSSANPSAFLYPAFLEKTGL